MGILCTCIWVDFYYHHLAIILLRGCDSSMVRDLCWTTVDECGNMKKWTIRLLWSRFYKRRWLKREESRWWSERAIHNHKCGSTSLVNFRSDGVRSSTRRQLFCPVAAIFSRKDFIYRQIIHHRVWAQLLDTFYYVPLYFTTALRLGDSGASRIHILAQGNSR